MAVAVRGGHVPGVIFCTDQGSGVHRGLRRIERFATRAAARVGVAAWIEDYNHHRRHSSLGRVSPVDYERSLAGKDAA